MSFYLQHVFTACFLTYMLVLAATNFDSRQSVSILPSLVASLYLPGASKGTPGDAKCVTEILGWEIK